MDGSFVEVPVIFVSAIQHTNLPMGCRIAWQVQKKFHLQPKTMEQIQTAPLPMAQDGGTQILVQMQDSTA